MYTNILVATNGDDLSHKAVASGIDLAALTGAALYVVKVVPHYARSYFEGSIPVSMDDSARIEQQWLDEGKLVVTLEGPSQRPIMAAIDAINAMPGVLSAALIYHQFDEVEAEGRE